MDRLYLVVPASAINYRWGREVPKPGEDTRFSSDWLVDVAKIAAAHEVTVAEIRGDRHFRAVARARFEVCDYLRRRGWSYPKIGMILGGRDHTTAMHGVRRFAQLVAEGAIQPVFG